MAPRMEEQLDVAIEQRDEALRLLKEERARIQKLEAQVAWLIQQMFGRRSERRTDSLTGDLFPEDDGDPVEPETEPEREKKDRPSRPPRPVGGRRKLPDDLPRQTTVIRPSETDCHCGSCGVDKQEIGRDVSERLEYQPGSLFVLREERVKLSCPSCQEGVACAPLPPRPIDRGLPGPGLLAFVVTSKYGDHSTLYRLEDILARHGLSVARSTMCGWVAAVATLLDPIAQEVRRQVLESGYVRSDDTSVRLLGDPEEGGGSSKSFVWLYRSGPGLVLYEFRRGRSRDGPSNFLAGYEGYLQVDGYGGYDEAVKNGKGRIIRVACWAHVRRYFVKAEKSDPALAVEMLGMIRALYAIEREAKKHGLTQDQRLTLRQQRAVPILARIGEWLNSKKDQVLPSSLIGEAITYALGQWEALQPYARDGLLEIDNNFTEQAIRPVALGRKNWLFFAREAGGHRAATILTLVHGCKELGGDPFAYLRHVLDAVSTTPRDRIHELTPRGWIDSQSKPGAEDSDRLTG